MTFFLNTRKIASIAVLGALFFMLHTAEAQLKPRVLILIDTSGSMAWALDGDTSIYGDGSFDPYFPGTSPPHYCCPGDDRDGDTFPNDSRLYVVKEAFSQMIYMSGDIEFGLSEFPHEYSANTTGDGARACWGLTHYYTWNDTLTNSYSDDCLKVRSSSTTSNYNWLRVPFYTTASDYNPMRLLMFLDHTEYCQDADCGFLNQSEANAAGSPWSECYAGTAPYNDGERCYRVPAYNPVNDIYSGRTRQHLRERELRADGSTPLGGSIQRAGNYMITVRDADPYRDCRPYFLVVLADGDSDDGYPQSYVQTTLRANNNIDSWFIGMTFSASGFDNLAVAGGHPDPLTNGAWLANNQEQLTEILYNIVAEAVIVETCNDNDDDCDGDTDEGCDDPGFFEQCIPWIGDWCPAQGLLGYTDEAHMDKGECEHGLLECVNGSEECVGGTGPESETCNGLDDDCDEQIDNALSYPAPPPGGSSGDCRNTTDWTEQGECQYGTYVCAGVSGWTCVNYRPPQEEICNGLDDDCDGLTDEDSTDPGERSYVAGTGGTCGDPDPECVPGIVMCLDLQAGSGQNFGLGCCVTRGTNLECTKEPTGPEPETCNNADDDCDGETDEGVPPDPCGTLCSTIVGGCPGGTDSNSNGYLDYCEGARTCEAGGVLSSCTYSGGSHPPDTETCNALDDDCDGDIDEDLGSVACGTECSSIGGCPTGTDTSPADGYLDYCQGTRTCSGGSWGACSFTGGSAESCNNADDDCDGQIDEGVLRTCGTDCGTIGGCTTEQDTNDDLYLDYCQGTETCSAGVWSGSCIYGPGAHGPGSEICNGVDDDCNGETDEPADVSDLLCGVTCDSLPYGCPAGTDTSPADGYLDYCQGTQTCSTGSWGSCSFAGAEAEVCDGNDNNCDGNTDEGLIGDPCGGCTNGSQCPGGVNEGECQQGVTICDNGSWSGCSGNVDPQAEICDEFDNDCDGLTDEEDTSPGPNPSHIDWIGDSCTAGAGTETWCDGAYECQAGNQVCVVPSPPEDPEVSCDNHDNDCDGLTDEALSQDCPDPGFPNGVGRCRWGSLYCTSGTWTDCTGQIGPQSEVCNGEDDDCDGSTDEPCSSPGSNPSCITVLGANCGLNEGICIPGTLMCVPTPTGGYTIDCCRGVDGNGYCEPDVGPNPPEVCNNQDDNCNGQTDEGLFRDCGACLALTPPCVGLCKKGTETCTAGVWGNCTGNVDPDTEVCDGFDNNCNGDTDEGLSGNECGTECSSISGGCTHEQDLDGNGFLDYCEGLQSCTGGLWQGCEYNMESHPPTIEECNGDDDDCDGQTDEEYPEQGQLCGQEIGECHKGHYECVCDNAPDPNCDVECVDEGLPEDEICDNKDNDCDGVIDGIESDEECGIDIGECEKGVLWCIDGDWVCQGGIGPAPEVCDGKDNDCDGETDEDLDVECPIEGSECIEGKCAEPCDPGSEFPCPAGMKCEEHNGKYFCIGDKCQDDEDTGYVAPDCDDVEECEDGYDEPCKCEDGLCVSYCYEKVCPEDEVCVNIPPDGQCYPDTCYSAGCPDGEVCVDGACVPDPCADVECAEDEFCRDGQCRASCADVDCPAGEGCRDGRCVDDACAGVKCVEGYECINGTCQKDAECEGVECEYGTICRDGECVDDPCHNIDCPDGEECIDGDCYESGGIDPIEVDDEEDDDDEGDGKAGKDGGPPDTSGGSKRVLATGAGGIICSVGNIGESASLAGGLIFCLMFIGGLIMRAAYSRSRRLKSTLTLMAMMVAVLMWTAGCNVQPYVFGEGDGSTGSDADTSAADGDSDSDSDTDQNWDAGSDADFPCDPNAKEVCNNLDDDCDGETDEDFNLQKDPNNCGSCGNVCAFPHATAKCEDGECAIHECDTLYYDKNDKVEDGCEYYCKPESDDEDYCDGIYEWNAGDPEAVDNDCDGETDEDHAPGSPGLNINNDPENCGSCGHKCNYANAIAGCASGECFLDECHDGYYDIDPDAGCEYYCDYLGPETCNANDDDCDGKIDNGNPPYGPGGGAVCGTTPTGDPDEGACEAGNMYCIGGRLVCQNFVGPEKEVCDAVDNDCDGETNELADGGVIFQQCGGCVGFPQCTANPNEGVCQRGIQTCNAGGTWSECINHVDPGNELTHPCNGLDDDCDGFVDEDELIGSTQPMRKRTGGGAIIPCGGCVSAPQCTGDPEEGECSQGEQVCYGVYPDGGPIWVCQGDQGPVPEECNNLDDDCNGNIETSANQEVSQLCGGCDVEPQCTGNPDQGECAQGIQYCEHGTWQGCIGDLDPADSELCDGKDNDCNGLVDDNVSPSTDGRLGQPCGYMEGDCVAGTTVCADGGVSCSGGDPSGNPEMCGRISGGTGDEDCDGQTDEENDMTGGIFTTCGGCDTPGECPDGATQGSCETGVWRCVGGPDIDDKQVECCRGIMVEGNGSITCIEDIGPAQEICDGKDNDCDGLTDENADNPGPNSSFVPGTDQACGTDEGECTAGSIMCLDLSPGAGQIFGLGCCVTRGADLECQTDIVTPQDETCNNDDDDCDGDTDESASAPGTNPSYVEALPCGTVCTGLPGGGCTGRDVNQNNYLDYCEGSRSCSGGSWQSCVYGPGTHPVESEECDLQDNDCDGLTDDSLAVIPCGTTCDSIGGCTGTQDDGPANGFLDYCEGEQTCSSGTWSSCDAPVSEPEGNYSCDDLDNDCDGFTDEVFYADDDVFACGNSCASYENCTTDFQDSNADCTAGADTRTCLVDCVSGNCTITGCKPGYADTDQSAPWSCTCKITNNGVELCDGEDNDCNGNIDDGFDSMPEVCDGVDNDCDGATDADDTGSQSGNKGDGLSTPDVSALCYTLGACSGQASLSCTGGTWSCSYTCTPPLYCSGGNPVGNEAGHCDGEDNDCDGATDEDFYGGSYKLGETCTTCDIPAFAGKCEGICYNEGTWMCNVNDPSTTLCCSTAPCNPSNELDQAGSPEAYEVCDGEDDDCDGYTDEDLSSGVGTRLETVTVTIGSTDVEIFKYEASQAENADTTGTACSTDTGSTEPWVNVDWYNARAACCQLNRGNGSAADCSGEECCSGSDDEWDLCMAPDWQYICANSDTTVYPYGNPYEPQTCNGYDRYAGTDVLLECGHSDVADCYSSYTGGDVFDQSGNAEEWTGTPVYLSGNRAFEVRGGSYNDLYVSLACDYDAWAAEPDLAMPNLGFRCCKGRSPAGSCDATLSMLADNFDGSEVWTDGAITGGGCSGANTWNVGSPSWGSAVSSPNVYATNLGGNYAAGECSYIASPTANLADCNGENVRLRFAMRHRFAVEDDGSCDPVYTYRAGAVVEVSSNGGSSWSRITTNITPTYDQSLETGITGGLNGVTSWADDRDSWTVVTAEIPNEYLAATFRVRIRFESHTSYSREEGLYVDNVFLERY